MRETLSPKPSCRFHIIFHCRFSVSFFGVIFSCRFFQNFHNYNPDQSKTSKMKTRKIWEKLTGEKNIGQLVALQCSLPTSLRSYWCITCLFRVPIEWGEEMGERERGYEKGVRGERGNRGSPIRDLPSWERPRNFSKSNTPIEDPPG
jgi:hypothetical protein